MPTESDLRRAVRELADEARDAAPLLDRITAGPAPGTSRPGLVRRAAIAGTALAIVVVAILIATLTSSHRGNPPVNAHCGQLSAHDCATALRLAHQEANQSAKGRRASSGPESWPRGIQIVAARVRTGTISDHNIGPACTSGRYIDIELIGDFNIAVSEPTYQPGTKHPNFTVHAVETDVDASTGKPCLGGVITGRVRPPAGSTILYQHHR